MQQICSTRRLIAVLSVFLSLSIGCEDAPPVEIRPAGTEDTITASQGTEVELPRPNREALLVIFDGSIGGDAPDVSVAEVFDADVHAGPHDPAGDPHMITRGRMLDENGETIWSRRVPSLFQSLEMLAVIIEQLAPVDLDVELVYELVREDYPELLRFPVRVPVTLDGADTFVLEYSDEEREWNTLGSFEVDDLEEQATAPEPSFDYEIDTMIEHGDPVDHVDLAILGDGYTAEERSEFEADARAVANRFRKTAPMQEHADLFNIHAIWTPSAESGAGFDCNHFRAPEGCEQGFRDTRFDTTFVIPAVAEEYNIPMDDVSDRVAMPLQYTDIYEVASLAHFDEILLISNTDKVSGFAGGYNVSIVTNYDNRDRFLDTAVHELGHTLGWLGDEYVNPADACYYNVPTVPLPGNIDDIDDGEVKWSEWTDGDTPIPTPAYVRGEYPVGAYEGAYNCPFLVRPSYECKMRSSTDEFCPVCTEQMIHNFYSAVTPAPDEPATATVDADGNAVLTVPVRSDARSRYDIIWTVNGDVIYETSPTVRIPTDNLSSQVYTDVTATVRNNSEVLQTPHHSIESIFEFQLVRAE